MAFLSTSETEEFIKSFNATVRAVNSELDSDEPLSESAEAFIQLLVKKSLTEVLVSNSIYLYLSRIEKFGSCGCDRCGDKIDSPEHSFWQVILDKFVLYCPDCTVELTTFVES